MLVNLHLYLVRVNYLSIIIIYISIKSLQVFECAGIKGFPLMHNDDTWSPGILTTILHCLVYIFTFIFIDTVSFYIL